MRISSRQPGWVARTSRYWRIIGVSSAGAPAILASSNPGRSRNARHRAADVTAAEAAGALRADGVHGDRPGGQRIRRMSSTITSGALSPGPDLAGSISWTSPITPTLRQ